MYHIPFEESPAYKAAILIKPNALRKHELEKAYLNPLVQMGLSRRDVIAFSMEYGANGKATASTIKEYLEMNCCLP